MPWKWTAAWTAMAVLVACQSTDEAPAEVAAPEVAAPAPEPELTDVTETPAAMPVVRFYEIADT